jgi:hypothetical protein
LPALTNFSIRSIFRLTSSVSPDFCANCFIESPYYYRLRQETIDKSCF